MVPMGVHRSVMVAQMRVWVCKTSCNEDPLISGFEIKSKVQFKKTLTTGSRAHPLCQRYGQSGAASIMSGDSMLHYVQDF